MRDVHEAMAALARITGRDGLGFDRDGRAVLAGGGEPLLAIVRLDDRHLALEAAIEPAGAALGREKMIGYLTANYLGVGTGAGAVALGADGTTPVLVERVDVGPLDADGLKARIDAFLRYRAFWRDEALAAPLPAVAAALAEPAARSGGAALGA